MCKNGYKCMKMRQFVSKCIKMRQNASLLNLLVTFKNITNKVEIYVDLYYKT